MPSGEEKGDGPVLQLGRPKQQEEQNVISADASCLAWIQSKLELVLYFKTCCARSSAMQLFPAEGSELRKDIDDPSQWLQSLWEPDVHTNVASRFLMDVKV
eukprot:1159301-Pelagomonas_calceolata.AAC.10